MSKGMDVTEIVSVTENLRRIDRPTHTTVRLGNITCPRVFMDPGEHPLQQPVIAAGISSAETTEATLGTLPPESVTSTETAGDSLRLVELSLGCTRMLSLDMLPGSTSKTFELIQTLPHSNRIKKDPCVLLTPRLVKVAMPLTV